MIRITTIFLATCIMLVVSFDVQAQCAQCDDGCSACAAPGAACCSAPACQAAGRCCGGPRCVGKAEMVDVEKHCWKIECEEVCIPAVRFPWEHGGNKLTLFSLFQKKGGCGKSSCCDSSCDGGCTSSGYNHCGGCDSGCSACVPPKCGFVKTIRDLKKETYTEKVCEYSISLAGPGATGCDCAAPGGCAACTSPTEETIVPTTAGYLFAPQQYAQPTPAQVPTQASLPAIISNGTHDQSPQPVRSLPPRPDTVPAGPPQTIPVMNEIPASQGPNMPSAQLETEKAFRLVSQQRTKAVPKVKTNILRFFKNK